MTIPFTSNLMKMKKNCWNIRCGQLIKLLKFSPIFYIRVKYFFMNPNSNFGILLTPNRKEKHILYASILFPVRNHYHLG